MSHLGVVRFVILGEGDPLDAPQRVEASQHSARVAHVCKKQLPIVHQRHAGGGAAVARVAAGQLWLAQCCVRLQAAPNLALSAADFRSSHSQIGSQHNSF